MGLQTMLQLQSRTAYQPFRNAITSALSPTRAWSASKGKDKTSKDKEVRHGTRSNWKGPGSGNTACSGAKVRRQVKRKKKGSSKQQRMKIMADIMRKTKQRAVGWEDTMHRWYSWLQEVKKQDDDRRKEDHQKPVSRMVASAEGGAGLVHKITRPTAWRRGGQVLEEVERDVRPLKGCEEKSTGSATRKCKIWRTRRGRTRCSPNHTPHTTTSSNSSTSSTSPFLSPPLPLVKTLWHALGFAFKLSPKESGARAHFPALSALHCGPFLATPCFSLMPLLTS